MTNYSDDRYFNSLISSFNQLKEIDAVVLGGSRSTGTSDKSSDYDVYVYLNSELSLDEKRKTVMPFCSQGEIGNHYWESEDNCVLKSGTPIDIIYRKTEMFSQYLKHVVDEGNPFNSYTTCFWHNILNSKVLFDKTGEFTALQKKYNTPYPEELRKNIIQNNRNLLSGKLPSYDMQIKKAESRGDLVSVHHRITEFLASYFDIIFALNKLTHPGEKRLVSLCKRSCKILPEKFEENINALLASVTTGGSYEIVYDMVQCLDKVLEQD